MRRVNPRTRIVIATVIVALVIAICVPLMVEAQRDRGINQPGAAGNRGARDPGINQPGRVGNVGVAGYGGSARQARVVRDPGVNQPGAANNRRGPG